MAKICLTAIVKNEEAIIERMLRSAAQICDAFVINDTGSTDKTKEIINRVLSEYFDLSKPGSYFEIINEPWKNFKHNRTVAFKTAREIFPSHYALVLDADETIHPEESFDKNKLTADCYDILMEYGNMNYMTTRLFNNDLPWEYEGVIHNFPICSVAKSRDPLPSLKVKHIHDGIRSKDSEKTKKDLIILHRALIEEPEALQARYLYYTAQTYFELQDFSMAINFCQKRVAAGGWPEEIWNAKYMMAQALELAGTADWSIVEREYLEAFEYRPTRAEPLFHVLRHYRLKNKHNIAYMYGKMAMSIPYPKDDKLFIRPHIHFYCIPDELSLACYHTRRYQESIELIDFAFKEGYIPDREIQRMQANRTAAVNAMKGIKPGQAVVKKEKKIQQAYVSPGINHFAAGFHKRYKTSPYTLINKPALFYGCYFNEDINAILKHQSLAILIWGGSDIIKCTSSEAGRKAFDQFKFKKNIKHVAQSHFIHQDLLSLKVPHLVMPVTTVDLNDFQAVPPGEAIYFYTSMKASEFYNQPFFERLVKDLKFEYYICNCNSYLKPELIEIYKKCFIGLRLTPHDGFSHTVAEMGLMGRRCIHNGNQPNCINYTNLDSVSIQQLIYNEYNFHKNKPEAYMDIAQDMRKFIDVPDDWTYEEFWKDKE